MFEGLPGRGNRDSQREGYARVEDTQGTGYPARELYQGEGYTREEEGDACVALTEILGIPGITGLTVGGRDARMGLRTWWRLAVPIAAGPGGEFGAGDSS